MAEGQLEHIAKILWDKGMSPGDLLEMHEYFHQQQLEAAGLQFFVASKLMKAVKAAG